METKLKTQPATTYLYSSEEAVFSNDYVWDAVRSLLPKTPCSVLDVGCGNGSITKKIAELGHSVMGVDTSTSGVSIANKTYRGIPFFVHSAYQDFTPLKGKVDCVVSCEMIEHLNSPKVFFENAYRTLKPGGTLIVTTPYHGYLKNLLLSVFNRWDRHFSVDWEGGHIKFFSEDSLTEMLIRSGFQELSFHNTGRLPLLWKSMVCLAKKPL